jgi:hypothetical protein
MVLVAWVAPDFDAARHAVNLLDDTQLLVVTRGSPEHMDLAEARTGRVRTEYVAQSKEKLAEVAKKFGMGSHDLARINRISYDTVLSKGQAIIVYQVADPNRSKRADEQWKKTPRARRGKLSGTPAARTASANLPDEEADAESEDEAEVAPGNADQRAVDETAGRNRADVKPSDGKSKRSSAEPADVGRGGARQPEATKPETKKPEPKQAEARKPEAKKPEARQPATKKPEAKQPETKQPEAKQPEARKPEPKKSEAKQPEPKKPEPKPETKKSEPKQPEPRARSGEAAATGGTANDGPVTNPAQLR